MAIFWPEENSPRLRETRLPSALLSRKWRPLAGGDSFTVAGFDVEVELSGYFSVDLELPSHDGLPLRVDQAG